MGKRGPKPKEVVSTVWRPELAYAVGLLASDGCLSRDGRHIDFTSKDKELVQLLCSCLGLFDLRVSPKSARNREAEYFHAQISSVIFHKWLQSIGMAPAKSKTMTKLQIPDAVFFHFLRGVWDGDGSIYGAYDTRWPNSFAVVLSIASASPAFLVWLRDTIERLTGVRGVIVGSERCQQLRFAKASTNVLCEHMFPTPHVPHLPRKFTKLQKAIMIGQPSKS